MKISLEKPTAECERGAALDRRSAMTAALSLAAAVGAMASGSVVSAGAANAADEMDHSKMDHYGMDHSKMDHAGTGAGAASGPHKHQALINSALNCVNRGDVCRAHCIELMGQGDKSLAQCLRLVSAMVPMCSALATVASLSSPRIKEVASACLVVLEDCAKECKVHAPHHAVCKACLESCEACIKDCKSLT